MDRSLRPGGIRVPLLLVCVLAALVAWALAAAGPAAAAPTEPTMTLDNLRTALTGAGPGGIDGYFKTVLQGATITPVAVKILAVADGENPYDGSALILFQITDLTVLSEGGFAEGMSGSPLFIGDATDPQPTDDLVGGTSYGDMFTTNGLGLATPIEYMASIETSYTVAPLGAALGSAGFLVTPAFKAAGPVLPKTHAAVLARPVRTRAGAFKKFIVARSPTVARTLHPAAGTAVFVPLSAVEVGGLPSASKAFKRLSAEFEKRGVDVIAAGAGLGASDEFTTDLVSGASVAAVFASGDFFAADIGTVTYANPNTNVVVAFGHPADLDGPSGLDMANAYVDGIWSDSLTPFKLASLGAIRGLFTQDRTYGIAGVLGADTPEVPLDASATLGTNPTVPSHTDVPLWVADNPNYGSFIIATACYVPVFKATDALAFPGHATMDSTVTVADALAPATTYTTELKNVFDDTFDVGTDAGLDVYDMLSYLLANPNGTAPATADSVSFVAQLSPAHASLQVLDFSVRGGLKHGANTIRTFVRAYGEKGTHEEDVTLNIPANVATTGTISVYDSSGLGDPGDPLGWSDASRLGLGDSSTPTIPNSESLPDLVNDVDAWLLNDTLNVTLDADVANPFTVPIGLNGQPINIVTTTRPIIENGTTWFLQGNLTKESSFMRLRPRVPFVAAKHSVKLIGFLAAEDSNATTVAIYKGSGTTPIATVPVRVTPDGAGQFSVKVKLGKSTTTFKAVWGGSEEYIGATASCKVRVMH
jgi:hypothetical protein